MIQRQSLKKRNPAYCPAIRAASGAVADAILARFPAQTLTVSGSPPPSEIMVMPGGVHLINAFKGNDPIEIHVQVDRDTATALQRALRAHLADGSQRPYFDFDHDETSASMWPEEFLWKDSPAPGVYARVDWSKSGADAVSGKTYRSFSPAFHVDNFETTKDSPAKVIGSPFIMGGLVNNPAFRNILPLWARSGSTEHNTNMNAQELAALKARLATLETEITTLKAHTSPTAEQQATLRARESEAEAAKLKIENAELKARNSQHEEAVRAQRVQIANEAITAATARGVFPAQPTKDSAEEKEIARWRKLIEEDPENATLLAKVSGNPALGEPITGAGQRASVELIRPAINNVVRAYSAARTARERGEVYTRDIRALMAKEESCQVIVHAANSLGTLAQSLVVQRTLDLLKISFPALSRISVNFTEQTPKIGDTISTRLVTVPTVGTYHVDNGYVSAAAGTTDVPITIAAGDHKFIQVEFNANEWSGTRRLLFGEQEEAMHYAIGLDFMDTLYALFLAANYTEAATVKALVDFNRAAVIKVGTDMQVGSAGRNANTGTRTLLLNSNYYGKLAEDVVVVSGLYNRDSGSAIKTGQLPEVNGFLPVEAPNLPATANLVGFGMRADAVAMATAIPGDYSNQPGVPATAMQQVITNPDTGLAIQLTIFSDHLKGKSYMRLAWIRSIAKGNVKAGQLVKSAA